MSVSKLLLIGEEGEDSLHEKVKLVLEVKDLLGKEEVGEGRRSAKTNESESSVHWRSERDAAKGKDEPSVCNPISKSVQHAVDVVLGEVEAGQERIESLNDWREVDCVPRRNSSGSH